MNPIELDTSLLSLLPPWYREVLDYQQICLTEQQQFEALAEEIVGVADNFFFQTMDERAVGMWEQVFRIVPNPQVESLAFRRTRVLNRISTRPPYTLGFLYQKLDELIGPGEWKVTVDYPNYTLYIESAAQNQNYATELAFTINRIKPAHIVWVNSPFVRTGLLLSDPEVLQAMEHEALQSPRFLPVRVNREGDLSGALASADQLGRLGQYVEKLLHQIAREVRDGNIDADPCCRSEDDSFCKYCDWADACHFQDGRDGDHLHYILPVKPEEFWRQVEEETERGGGN